jgi:drug/metabolite transporter (DMT)-like permease
MQPNHEASASSGAISLPRRSPSWPFTAGIPLLLIALFFQTVTTTGGSYTAVLIIALALTALADACFIYAFRRGGVFARSLSMLCLLPTLFVVADLLRRAPYLFTP